MRTVFADAGYWIGLLNPRDGLHSVFVVMGQRGITEALTHDHHFEQAGFRALLRDLASP